MWTFKRCGLHLLGSDMGFRHDIVDIWAHYFIMVHAWQSYSPDVNVYLQTSVVIDSVQSVLMINPYRLTNMGYTSIYQFHAYKKNFHTCLNDFSKIYVLHVHANVSRLYTTFASLFSDCFVIHCYEMCPLWNNSYWVLDMVTCFCACYWWIFIIYKHLNN
jgi:hypothetical protein